MKALRGRYGAGRLSAAVLGAPTAALVASVALPKLVPASSDVRYLAACVVVVPAMALAPYLALAARSGARAWGGTGLALVASGLVLWSAAP